MKNLALILLFMFTTNYIQAQQNLIYNGDFELFDSCPDNNSQINRCISWNSPTNATPDYYNSCANIISPISGIPSNYGGFQNTFDGQGYAGIWAHWDFTPCDYREYIQTELIQELKIGKKYCFSFYASLGGSTGAIKKIGALFTNYNISRNDECEIFANPQILYDDYLTDTTNWFKIAGCFIANGGERYLTIGFFSTENNILPLEPDSITFGEYAAYYYIDGVTIYEDTIINFPNVLTPNGDGKNDFIDFYQLFGETNVAFELYNRWGTKVFNTTDNKQKWRGNNTNGKPLTDGVYYYLINYDTPIKTIKGYIQIFNN